MLLIRPSTPAIDDKVDKKLKLVTIKNLVVRGKRFFRRPITLLIIPPRGAQTRNLRFPVWCVVLSGFMLTLLLTVVVADGVRYYQARAERRELARLRTVNLEQKQQLATLREQAQSTQEYLEEVKVLEQRIRERSGLQKSEDRRQSSRSGSGGVNRRPRLSLLNALFDPQDPDPEDVKTELAHTLREAEDALNNLERLEKDLDDHFKYLAAFPDQRPVTGEITSKFGYRSSPFGGRRSEFHNGVDLAANYGAAVSAAGDGVVVYAGYQSGYGRTVVISHGFGYRSSYSHLSNFTVKAGEQVKKGGVIGRAGSSGRSTGPHVHFMIEKDGVLVDPLPFLNG